MPPFSLPIPGLPSKDNLEEAGACDDSVHLVLRRAFSEADTESALIRAWNTLCLSALHAPVIGVLEHAQPGAHSQVFHVLRQPVGLPGQEAAFRMWHQSQMTAVRRAETGQAITGAVRIEGIILGSAAAVVHIDQGRQALHPHALAHEGDESLELEFIEGGAEDIE